MNNKLAVITPKGILHQNNYYTCSRAISEQWFDQSSPHYMLEVQVLYEDDLLSIVLDFGELISVSKISVTNNYTQQELDEYFTKLNQLKLEIRALKNEKS